MRSSLRLLVLALALSGCGVVNARVVAKDGKQYNLDGTQREDPALRTRKATAAMDACAEEVKRVQDAFYRDAAPALAALAAALPSGGGKTEVVFTEADPLIIVEATARPRATKAHAAVPAPFEPATTALSASLRGALDATEHCSTANLQAIKVVWEEQHYLSKEDVHALLEAHWRATQQLARGKELAVTTIALGLAAKEAGRGRTEPLTLLSSRLADSKPLFEDVPFDHNLRREVMLQALFDTDESCGKRDADGKTPCDKVLGFVKQAKAAVGAVQDAKAGRVLSALQKASDALDGGASEDAARQARRDAVIALIPETPALASLNRVLAQAREGKAREARTAGLKLASSDGVAHLIEAAQKATPE